jgi:hypothetical protein
MTIVGLMIALFGVEPTNAVAKPDPKRRPCPACGAAVGRPCRGATGHAGRPHGARLRGAL